MPTPTRLLRLALVALLLAACPPDTEAASVRCTAGQPCLLTITLTGTVVSTLGFRATDNDGVLVATWECSGMEACGRPESDRTSLALHDDRVLGVTFTVDAFDPEPIRERHVGGMLAWVGDAAVRIASAGGGR